MWDFFLVHFEVSKNKKPSPQGFLEKPHFWSKTKNVEKLIYWFYFFLWELYPKFVNGLPIVMGEESFHAYLNQLHTFTHTHIQTKHVHL